MCKLSTCYGAILRKTPVMFTIFNGPGGVKMNRNFCLRIIVLVNCAKNVQTNFPKF